MQAQKLIIPKELYEKLTTEASTQRILELYGYTDADDFFNKTVQLINEKENMSVTGFALDTESAQYGIYNGYISGDTGYKAVTVSFSAIATKQGNTIINQQVLPMVVKRIDEDFRFLIDEKYKKIFLLSSYLRKDVDVKGKDVNTVNDENNSLSIQVKCLNTMNFKVYSMIPVEGLNTDARYETIEQLSGDIESLGSSNSGNAQVKTVEIDAKHNLAIGNAPKLEGNASKFLAIRLYAALMLNKVYRYDLSRIADADSQIKTLKRFASYVNGDIQNHAHVDYADDPNDNSAGAQPSDVALNTILYGPPGTGKTYAAVKTYAGKLLKAQAGQGTDWKKYYRIVTFHQSYSYEEFVEGIRPKLNNDNGVISYEIKPGIFKELCAVAAQDSGNKYLLIIDEINRGNIAKIFGELITLLEDDKRETMSVTLPYSQEPFTIPKNLYVLGTMNTADRSIALLDIALRRRFDFTELMPDYELPELNREIEGVHVGRLLKSCNEKISVMIDQDHQIGHSYFMKAQAADDLHKAWYKKVLPLVQEYFYNDWEKLEVLLGAHGAQGTGFIESRTVTFPNNTDIDDTTLFSVHQYTPDELPKALKALIDNEETSDTHAV